MSHVEAWVEVVDTESGYRFTRRFTASPIRIGRALSNNVCLPHSAIAAQHGEISIGLRSAHFRRHSWIKKSWIDGVRIRRGHAVKLTTESVISLGPFRIRVSFRVRDWRYERGRKVTPLALVRPLGWDVDWDLERMADPYLAIETWPRPTAERGQARADATLRTFATGLLEIKRSLRREGGPKLRAFQDPGDLVNYLVDPRAPQSRLDDLDEELTSIAARVALDFGSANRNHR